MTARVPPDHIGWDLVRAARWWKRAFIAEVTQAGHPWFAEARGRLVEHIGRNGIEQGALADRAGLTKQAVAQHLDRLEADGLISRVPYDGDARKRRVIWTATGQAALDDIDRAKASVEADLARRIGKVALRDLSALLKKVAPDRQEN